MGSANIWTPAVFNQTATTGCNIIGPLNTPQGEEFTHNKWAVYRSMLQSESAPSTIFQPFGVGILSLFIPSPNKVWYNNNTRLEYTQNYIRKNKEIKKWFWVPAERDGSADWSSDTEPQESNNKKPSVMGLDRKYSPIHLVSVLSGIYRSQLAQYIIRKCAIP